MLPPPQLPPLYRGTCEIDLASKSLKWRAIQLATQRRLKDNFYKHVISIWNLAPCFKIQTN